MREEFMAGLEDRKYLTLPEARKLALQVGSPTQITLHMLSLRAWIVHVAQTCMHMRSRYVVASAVWGTTSMGTVFGASGIWRPIWGI